MNQLRIGGTLYTLSDDITVIGRGDQADLKIDSTKLSRLHVRVSFENQTAFIEDLGSKNGTFINGERISGKTKVTEGDSVKFADLEAVFVFPEESKPSSYPVRKKEVLKITPEEQAKRNEEKQQIRRKVRRKKNIQMAAAAVIVLVILAALVLAGSKTPEGLEEAQQILRQAETDIADLSPVESIEDNTASITTLQRAADRLGVIPSELTSEYGRAQLIKERIESLITSLKKKNTDLKAVKTASDRYAAVLSQISAEDYSPEKAIADLEQFRNVFANSPESALALEQIFTIRRDSKKVQKDALRTAETRASSLLAEKKYKETLALLNAALSEKYSMLEEKDLDRLREKRAQTVSELREYFADSVKRAVADARSGDCEKLKQNLSAEYERIGFSALKGELDQALQLIDSVREQRLEAARERIRRELEQVPELRELRKYEEVSRLYRNALGQITEPELKRSIEKKLLENKLDAVAKKFVIRYVNEKGGVKLEEVGFIAQMTQEVFTLEMDGHALPLTWNRISDEEFSSLFDLAAAQYRDPELYVACAVDLLDRGSILSAGNYLKRAKALSADIEKEYPEMFASCFSRIDEIKKNQETEKKEQVKRLAALKQRRANIKPGVHPMLYFGPQECAALGQTVKSGAFGPRWSKLLSVADGHLNGPVRGTRNFREALGVAATTSFAYAVTKDTRYADRAKKEVWALLKAKKWHTVVHFNKGADLETAEASLACGLFYDWCYDALSSEDRSYFRERALELGVRIYLSSIEKHRDWWMDNYVTNWCGVCHGGSGVLALSLYDESDEAKRAVDYAWKHVPEFLKHVCLEDGGGHEGVMYFNYGFTFGLYFAAAAERFFGTDKGLFDDLISKKAGYWNCYMQDTWGWFANFNDMSEKTGYGLLGANHRQWEGGPNSVVCALMESRMQGGDPLLLWAADNGGHAFYFEGISPFYFIWRRKSAPPVAPADKPKLAPAVLFKGAGHVIFQSPLIWMAYNGGWTSNKSHSNRDLGTFVLSCGGERMISDPGYGVTETKDHTSYVINGTGQPRDVRGTFTKFGSGRQFHCFASDLSECYPDTPLRSLVRHGVMVRGQYMVFLDSMTASSDSTFEFRIQTRKKMSIDSQNRKAEFSGDKKLYILSPAPDDSLFAKGGRTGAGKSGEPCSTLSVKTSGKQKSAVFITVFYPEEAGPCPSASVDVSGGGGSLIIAHAGGQDKIKFILAGGGLTLVSVNGESAAKIGKPSGETVPQAR